MSKCAGCGVKLQDKNPELDGYVEDLNHLLCKRCFEIKHYNHNKLVNKTNSDYMEILDNIRDNDIVVYVSSLLTLNLDYINKFKNIILVLTKRDALPKSIKDTKIIDYVKKRYNNLIDVLVVSAYKKYNLDNLYNRLLKYKENNIYFVGITNSGKSTLINELIKSYGNSDYLITTSNYPSTTLGLIDVEIGKLRIKDTPGLVISDSIINKISSKDIKKINNKKEIKPITMQISGKGAILIDDYFRIEYETDNSSMVFYLSNNIKVEGISVNNPRLLDCKKEEYNIMDNSDLVIEDMGFIKITKSVKLDVYNKFDAYVYVRDKFI